MIHQLTKGYHVIQVSLVAFTPDSKFQYSCNSDALERPSSFSVGETEERKSKIPEETTMESEKEAFSS